MLKLTKFIKALSKMKKEDDVFKTKRFCELTGLDKNKASIEIKYLEEQGFLKKTSFYQPMGITIEYRITYRCEDYLKENISNIFFKWFPIVISIVSILISIAVAIYK